MLDLLIQIVLAVGYKVVGRSFQSRAQQTDTRWYIKTLYVILLLGIGLSLLANLFFCPFVPFYLAGIEYMPWQEWVYFGLFILLPFFNIGMWFWSRRLANSWAIFAAIGMVIGANFPVWLEFLRMPLQVSTNFEFSTLIFAFSLGIFLTSIVLLLSAKSNSKSPVPRSRYHFTKEPVFLSGFDQTPSPPP